MTTTLPQDTQYPWWITHAPDRARPYLLLARLDRPIGTWLLLLPCWWGAAVGAQVEAALLPNLWHMLLFAIGALIMRGAGCAFNDLIDKDIDAQVARTRNRPLASGQLSQAQGLAFVIALSLLGLIILLQFNALTVWLGISSLALVAAYPFMKRITWWPQAWLGLAFNWGALLGYTAATGELGWPMLWLYMAGIFWTLGYDTIYACQDVEDDALVGVRSTARLFGDDVPVWVARFFAASGLYLLISVLLTATPVLLSAVLLAVPALMFRGQVQALQGPTPNHLALFRGHRNIGLVIFLCLWLA
ncbi:MAG: 4-hydroxybenzoate octaprenyltransferase [Pseudomonadota bacterium]